MASESASAAPSRRRQIPAAMAARFTVASNIAGAAMRASKRGASIRPPLAVTLKWPLPGAKSATVVGIAVYQARQAS